MVDLQAHDRVLADQTNVGLASGYHRASKIIIGSDNIVRFEVFLPDESASWATNQFIDLNQENAVTSALETIRDRSAQDIANNPMLQNLLGKSEWDYNDRSQWESHVSKIVSTRYNEISGLDEYRAEGIDPNVTRVTDLKNIAPDLNNFSSDFENDCETMRSLEGIILTQLEQALLPSSPTREDNLKRNGAYVAVNGGVKYAINDPSGGHAFLISTLTGNIIEGTADPDEGYLPYNDTGIDYSYSDFIAGKLATTQTVVFDPADPSTMQFSISVYGSYEGHGDVDIIQKRQELIEQQDFDALRYTVFDSDTHLINEQYFKSAFYKAGKVIFTVEKPTGDSDPINDFEQTQPDLDNVLEGAEELPLEEFDKAFFTELDKILEDNGFKENGKPLIIETEDGNTYLFYVDPEDGVLKGYDVTEKNLPTTFPKIKIEVNESDPVHPTPEPVPIEICPQLQNPSFSELVDGHGILNDTSDYNDADALKDLLDAAKGLGLSENVYGHIEGAMDDGKFLGTAAAIDAIEASSAALESAQAAGLDDIQTERLVVKTFFENITEEDLITDTQAHDDIVPFDLESLEKARVIAGAMDSKITSAGECSIADSDNIEGQVDIRTHWDDTVDPIVVQVSEQENNITYTVKHGDTYSAIADRYYGSSDPSVYNALAAHNSDDPHKIGVGDQINLPSSLDGIELVNSDLVREQRQPEVLPLGR